VRVIMRQRDLVYPCERMMQIRGMSNLRGELQDYRCVARIADVRGSCYAENAI
jgi:hypothetical protein